MGKVLAVRLVGEQILKEKCKEVKLNQIKTKKIREICEDLKETLLYNEAYGLAAPQTGSNLRIIVVNAKKEQVTYSDPEDIPLTIMINPTWTNADINEVEDMVEEYESCASVPSIVGIVARYKSINLEYYDEEGVKIKKTISGFFARLIQHECDHLDGKLFLDKVDNGNFATKDIVRKMRSKKKQEEQEGKLRCPMKIRPLDMR